MNGNDIESRMDMIQDKTSGVDKSVSLFVFESNEMRNEAREKRSFFTIILLIVLLVVTNFGWILYESQFEVQEVTTTTQEVTTTQETADGGMNDFDVMAGDNNNG